MKHPGETNNTIIKNKLHYILKLRHKKSIAAE